MNLKLEILLLILGGFLRIAGTATSIWYFLTQSFNPYYLYHLCGLFIILPSIVFLTLTIFLSSIYLCKKDLAQMKFTLGVGIMITLGGPIGLPLFVYAIVLGVNRSYSGDFYIVESLARSTTLVEVLFESLPEIVLQIFNNHRNGKWNYYTWTSIIVTSVGALYSFIKLCQALDKVQHFEQASQQKQKRSAVVVTAPEGEDNFRENDCEVYDLNF